MAAIEMKNIVKKYGDGFPAVNDVSIDVADGEFMILVGPSGCGKSTLLRMIVGLEDITSGDMIIGEQAGQRPGAARPQPGDGVPELRALPAPDRLREHRVPAAARQGVRRRRSTRRSGRRRKTLELDEHLERKPGNLSGGQRQRVAMGRAIVRDADAFLFDEPLSNLDAKLRGQMRTEIARLQKRLGITTVYVTHDQTEAMTLGDRVAVLKRGVLQQLATPRELYDNPANLFVAGFIGSPPMNFLPATVEGTSVKLPFGTVEIPAEKAEQAPGQGPADRRHPARALRGRLGDGRAKDRARPSAPRSTSSSGSATRPTPTSRSRRRRRSRSSCSSSSATSTASRCAPSWSSPSTAPAGSRRATRPRSGSTPRRCTCSTRRPARTSPSTASTPARSPPRATCRSRRAPERPDPRPGPTRLSGGRTGPRCVPGCRPPASGPDDEDGDRGDLDPDAVARCQRGRPGAVELRDHEVPSSSAPSPARPSRGTPPTRSAPGRPPRS